MAIKLDCPRCKTLLQVPNKMAGGYVNCPHCKGRLWVDQGRARRCDPSRHDRDRSADGRVAAGVRGARIAIRVAGDEAARAAGSRESSARAAAATPWRVSVRLGAPPAPPVPPPAPAPRKKVARFITAEAADSTLAAGRRRQAARIAPGGRRGHGRRPRRRRTSVNPLVLLGALVHERGAVDRAGLDRRGRRRRHADASRRPQLRQTIEDEYFGAGNVENQGLGAVSGAAPRGAAGLQPRRLQDRARAIIARCSTCSAPSAGTDEKGLTGSRRRDKNLEEAHLRCLLSGG